jgi:Flp pilus assembly pilin Flp
MGVLQLVLTTVRKYGLSTAEEGQDLLEYGLLVALIAIVALAAVSSVGQTIYTVFWAAIAAASV